MKVLIVAKTRRGGGACVGGITEAGRSVRLIARDAATNAHAGLEYHVGEVWEIEFVPERNIIPPHIENVVVLNARRVKQSANLERAIRRFMPPVVGGFEKLFEGLVQATAAGSLFVADASGLPRFSTMFWIPDKPLHLDCTGKRIHYRYPTEDGGRTLTFVGFQEPVPEIPAGTLLRVSLAHHWRPDDKPDEESRCFVQLSGWIGSLISPQKGSATAPVANTPSPQLHSPQAAAPDLHRAREVLKQTFGFADFLPVQADVVARTLQHQDTLVVMPTGAGKSLCYQLPALLFDGLTVVVSPLIALMQDQVRQLRELEVPAVFLNSTLTHPQYLAATQAVREGHVKLLYVAPETLVRPETLLLLEQSRLACLAIDEAHCISEWGHDFRPEYRQIQQVRPRFPQALCLALTATATMRVREDIRRLLHIPKEGEFIASFNRPNLFLSAELREDGLAQTLAFLEKHRGQSGIIYCGTRKQVDELALFLQERGWPVLPYHAGLEDEVRRQNQERFIQDEVPIMVATIAFGMGINKSNIRFILHYTLPKNLENYYQEIGRAGRDGLPADCLLLHTRADAMLHQYFIDEGAALERKGREERLEAVMRYAETRQCRRIPLLAYFGEKLNDACQGCDNCAAPHEQGETTDATVAAQKFLSCVKRTGEIFGPAHIIAVLRGSRNKRVLEKSHDRLSTYGVGKEYSQEQWTELGRQFVQLGLLEQDFKFGSLRISAKGWEVLRKKEKVMVRVKRSLASPSAPAASTRPAGQHDPELFERLRQLRRKLADQAGLPPFIIFSDRSLLEMATYYPQDPAQFLTINGVGEAKLAGYGEAFLGVIREYCQDKGLGSRSSSTVRNPSTTSLANLQPRHQEVGALFAAGHTVEAIQQRFGIIRGTVVEHLRRYHEAGGQVDPQRVLALSRLSEADRTRVIAAFQRLGLERLAPVYEAFDWGIDYEELRLLRLYLLCGGH